jgi:peptidyl-prolyl cis-trans isomerase B (cyclophilin B)
MAGLSFDAVPRPVALLVLSIAACGTLVACGGKDKAKQATTNPTGAAAASPPPSSAACQRVKAPAPRASRKLPKPTLELDSSKSYRAVVDTSCGIFTIALDVKRAPTTTASFVSLARRRFFDGLAIHRIVSGFVIQGGDPKGDGSGGPGYKTVEAPPSDLRYTRGVVAMAKGPIEDAGTAGSQFFVVTGEDAQLQPEYALLGSVSGGMDVVDRIGFLPVQANSERPVDPVVIRSVRVVETKAR